MFADIFRYKLLYERGGWWVDMDVTCLKTFDIEVDYFFRSHPYLPMVNNVMKCPPKSTLMNSAFLESSRKVHAATKNYLIANEILNKHVVNLGLTPYIKEGRCNREWWADIEHFIYAKKKPSPNWYFIHWINEEWRTQQLNKNEFYYHSTLGELMRKYGVEASLKGRDTKYYGWQIKQHTIVQQLKPFLKKTPLFSLYKNYLQ